MNDFDETKKIIIDFIIYCNKSLIFTGNLFKKCDNFSVKLSSKIKGQNSFDSIFRVFF